LTIFENDDFEISEEKRFTKENLSLKIKIIGLLNTMDQK
jgi:hypothetical protein